MLTTPGHMQAVLMLYQRLARTSGDGIQTMQVIVKKIENENSAYCTHAVTVGISPMWVHGH